MAAQEVIITVPASFDEAARELTATAARQAGLDKFLLVEEPQAAFYEFTSHHRRDLAAALRDVRLVLVVDVGGGTTDFTLIQVQGDAANGEPILRRIAVGDHLMLGGDNMDASLARFAEERMLGGDRKFSATQWTQLLQAARDAKESLLGREAPDRYGVAVAAEGSRLLRGTLSTELGRDEVERLLLEGFLPACAPDEAPRRAARTALQELGLPYASDAAITRHLAAFLRRHAAAASAALGPDALASPNANAAVRLPRPDAILLNGGVFNSPKIADRLVTAMSAWWPESPRIPLLPHRSLDLAVARGAVCHGLAKKGLGRRIGGGSAHAFYVGLAGEKGRPTNRAVCLMARIVLGS
jgi:molecular chaperone DnaK (HSP70)